MRVDRYSANQVELTATATKRPFLASSEVLDPDWTATVNGKRAPLSVFCTRSWPEGALYSETLIGSGKPCALNR